MFNLDEDDEEELPVGQIKSEDSIENEGEGEVTFKLEGDK